MLLSSVKTFPQHAAGCTGLTQRLLARIVLKASPLVTAQSTGCSPYQKDLKKQQKMLAYKLKTLYWALTNYSKVHSRNSL